jgi:predicted ATP-dependent endonuclease of OLD family
MKEFKLKRMLLLSLKEDKAREVKFNSKRTIILGRNSTGKSCLLKSIYQTFGAEPQNLHPNWRDANVISLIEFSIENETLYILRNGKNYSIFDNKANQLKAFSKVSELSEYFTTLFDFKIQLPNKKGEIVTTLLC